MLLNLLQDENGNWITSTENLDNVNYEFLRNDLKEDFIKGGVQADAGSLKEVLKNCGTLGGILRG